MREKTAFIKFCLFLCIVVSSAGCDQTFQPIKENEDVPLSIYGYLDASVDTQWVRVTPLRDQLKQLSVKPEMHVTLEHVKSGNKTLMNDSLFLFEDGFNIINAWSVADIEPSQTYRLQAERSNGVRSSVTVTIPSEFPDPVLQDIGDGCRATLRIEKVDRLVDVQSKWHVNIRFVTRGEVVFEEERFYTIPYRSKVNKIAEKAYTVFINTNSEMDEIRNQLQRAANNRVIIEVLSREIFVASGGPNWDEEIVSLDDIAYTLPGSFSNVENGIGYMVGIVSKSIPYESCF